MTLPLMLLWIALFPRLGAAQPACDPEPVGSWGSHGDNGEVSEVTALAVGPTGDVYLLDGLLRNVVKVDGAGNVVARFGRPGSGPAELGLQGRGMGVHPGTGNLYVADTGNHRIQVFDPEGTFLLQWGSLGSGDGSFDRPLAIAFDAAGDVYVVDGESDRIQKFDRDGLFLGAIDSGLDDPRDLFIDGAGTLYVAELGHCVTPDEADPSRCAVHSGGRIQLFTTGLTPAGTFVDYTPNVGFYAIEGDGIFIHAGGYHTFQVYDPAGVHQGSWGGWFAATDPAEPVPADRTPNAQALAYDPLANELWVASFGARSYSAGTSVPELRRELPAFGSADGRFRFVDLAAGAHAGGLHADASGVYVADTYNSRIQQLTADGLFLQRFGSLRGPNPLPGHDEVRRPFDVARDPATGEIYTTAPHAVAVFDAAGTYLRSIDPGYSDGDPTKLSNNEGIAVGPDGLVYVANTSSLGGYVNVWDALGAYQGHFLVPDSASSLALDGAGHLFVADARRGFIYKYAPWTPATPTAPTPLAVFQGEPEVSNLGNVGIAVDAAGFVYAVDKPDHRVQIYTNDGERVGAFGSFGSGPAELDTPTDVAVSGDGHVYVVDSGKSRIQKWSPFVPPASCNPFWTSVVGATADQNSLVKEGGVDDWDSGAVSVAQITAGDGYLELIASETTTHRMVGLGNGDTDQHFPDIEHGLYLRADGVLEVRESGVRALLAGTYATGDVLRVAVVDGVVSYQQNGSTLYTSAVTPVYPLHVDTSLHSVGATLQEVRLIEGPPPPPPGGSFWTNVVGVTPDENNLAKTSGVDDWDSGAVSVAQIASGDGYLEFTASETTTHRVIGLGHGDTDQHFPDIELGIYLRADGVAEIRESGVRALLIGPYAAGEVFRVDVSAGGVRYLRDGEELHVSATTPTLPLAVDTSLHTVGASLQGVEIVDRGATADDQGPPTVEIVSPASPEVAVGELVEIRVLYSDTGTGVDPGTLRVTLDGREVTTTCVVDAAGATCPAPGLAPGSHALSVEVGDRAGNPGTARFTFEVVETDVVPPALSILEPPVLVTTEIVEILVEYFDPSGVDLETLAVRLDGFDITSLCSTELDTAVCVSPLPGFGAHSIETEVSDFVGNRATASRAFERIPPPPDRSPPVVEIVSPTSLVEADATPEIVVVFSDPGSGVDLPSLVVTLDGQPIDPAACDLQGSEARCEPPPLAPGLHEITVSLRDSEGNEAQASRTLELVLELALSIEAPASGFLTRDGRVAVSGTVSPLADSVVVGDVEAVLDDGTFLAVDVPLREGGNTLTAVARTAGGGVGTATVTVTRDSQPPRVVLQTPADGFVTTESQIIVAGEVLDPTSSTAETKMVRVDVNGIPASVTNRTFVLGSFLLQPGQNRIVATCEDAAGNVGRGEITVELVVDPVVKLEEMMGNAQEAEVGKTLANPLMVRVVNAIGNPLARRPVSFEVSRGDGAVIAFPEAARRLTVDTDEQGLAAVQWALGRTAGAGNHEVTVTAAGFPGALTFCASARPGVPARIKPIKGSDQTGSPVGVVGEPLPKPLLTQVFDGDGNPIAGVEVIYEVTAGAGHLAGSPTATVTTDLEGKAEAIFTLGPEAGTSNHRVEASFVGLEQGPARFAASARQPAPESATSFSGLVLDNLDEPVPGVTVRLEGTGLAALSDSEGRFRLAGVPVGTVELVADGSTTTRAGVWPELHFEAVTISGQENTLGMPIRLLPLDDEGARTVGGDEDVVLELRDVPGAQVTVFAGSATFPDGSRQGRLSFTQVHSDKLPMIPPRGSTSALAMTLQPPGVRFDPPAEVRVPSFGAPPGTTVEMFSFDHDLGEFVSIGSGSVTDDGRQLVSNPGFGIVKTGWFTWPVPVPNTDACGEGSCSLCVDGGPPVSTCSSCEVCNGGGCEPKGVSGVVASADLDTGETEPVLVALDAEVEFRASAQSDCDQLDYLWDFGDGGTSRERVPFHAFTSLGELEVSVEVTCSGCPAEGSDTLLLKVIELGLEFDELPEEGETTPNEEDPGGVLVVNNDDDDDDGTPDLEQQGPMEKENNLRELKVVVDREIQDGTLELGFVTGAGHVRVWKDDRKEAELELPVSWNVAEDEIPTELWLEGVAGSALQAVEIELLYTAEDEREVNDLVLLTVPEIKFLVAPDSEEFIGADEGVGLLAAAAFYPDFDDPEKLVPVADGSEFQWEIVEGDGVMAPNVDASEAGLTLVQLIAPVVGSINVARAELTKFRLEEGTLNGDPEIDADLEARAAPFRTLPGPPEQIALSASNLSVLTDGTERVTLTALVTDAVGNPVAPGTPIAWRLDSSPTAFEEKDELVFGGRASAVLRAPEVPVSQTVVAVSGSAEASLTIEVSGVTATPTATATELDLEAGQSTSITVSTDAVDETPVFWTTSNGTLSSTGTTVSGGSSSVELSPAGARPGRVVVTATVGGRLLLWDGRFFDPDLDVSVDIPALVGDATADGVTSVVWEDGSVHPVPFYATTPMRISGPPGASVRVQARGVSTVERYDFESSINGSVPGLVAGHSLLLGSSRLDAATAHSGSSSLLLVAGDTASIESFPDFGFEGSFRIRVALRPQEIAPATLLARGSAWSLDLLGDGTLRGSVAAAGGTVTVESSVPIQLEAWNSVVLEVAGSGLSLTLNGVPSAAPASLGPLETSSATIVIGRGYAGHLDDLAFEVQPSVQPGFALAGVDAANQVVLDGAGKAVLDLMSTGRASVGYFDSALLGFDFFIDEVPGGSLRAVPSKAGEPAATVDVAVLRVRVTITPAVQVEGERV